MVPIYSTPTMSTSGIPARSFETTLEGRVKAQIQPVGRREWTLSATYATPGELGTLMGFASGEWGHGPFVWIPPTAPAINMLTPAAASCDPEAIGEPSAPNFNSTVTAGGPLYLGEDAYAGRSWLNSNPPDAMFFGYTKVPVIPGQQVTGSAYLRGAGGVAQLSFYDADNAVMPGTIISTVASTDGTTVRSYVTATVPTGAAGCLVSADNASQAARPALTWTDGAFEWGAGEGCPKAIVETADRTALLASTQARDRQYSDLSFTIREVG